MITCKCRPAYRKKVALRKESVDRNPGFAKFAYGRIKSLSARRAWIEIRVTISYTPETESLSARRAWIEIVIAAVFSLTTVLVALRKESVDRNLSGGHLVDLGQKSLSARRAWIEIRGR